MLTGYLDLLKDIIKDLYDIKDYKKQNDDALINLSKLAKKIDEDLQKVSNNTGPENIFIRNLKQSLEGASSIIQKISFNVSLESLSFNLLISSLDMHLEILEDMLLNKVAERNSIRSALCEDIKNIKELDYRMRPCDMDNVENKHIMLRYLIDMKEIIDKEIFRCIRKFDVISEENEYDHIFISNLRKLKYAIISFISYLSYTTYDSCACDSLQFYLDRYDRFQYM